ncbi:MAG: Fic family protein [Hyphomonadaceae bacterium]|nr:Fic family protein [Hyphomonadaceae bacterium]
MSDDADPYANPKTGVLRNKLGIRSASKLDFHERELVTQRIRQGVPDGNFDLAHLKAIHRHLFQDVYDWAGEIRTVEINKGGDQFQFMRYIDTGMADVHRRREEADFFARA